jgi:hypothetical protein
MPASRKTLATPRRATAPRRRDPFRRLAETGLRMTTLRSGE